MGMLFALASTLFDRPSVSLLTPYCVHFRYILFYLFVNGVHLLLSLVLFIVVIARP